MQARCIVDTLGLSERFASERSLLERIMNKIPGFRGYISYTERCDTDRIVRSFEGERLLLVKNAIRSRMDAKARSGDLSELPILENADIRIEKLYRDITTAEPPVISTFSHNRPRISEEEFAKAIVLDDAVITVIDEMVASADSADSGAEMFITEMQKRIALIENVLSERKRILWGM